MGLTADQFVNANGNFSNVTFEINNDGYLTINPKAITITAKDQTYTYDGTIQGPAGTYTDSFDTYVTIEGLVGSDSLTSITLTGSATVAGTYSNAIVPSAALIGNKTDNYSISYANGTLRINKCTITIQAENQTKVYDNDPATDPTLTSMVSGVPVDGVVPAYTLSRAAGQNVGEYVISVNLGDNPNYDITASDGTLTISQKEAVLAWTDTEFYYDGKSHIPTATVSNLVDGDTCEVTAEGAQTEAGDSYTATATALSNPNYKLPADATTTFKIIGFTITFVDEDGTPLQSGIVAYGTKPAYTGKTPTKAATAQYTYEFLDWSPTITEVDGDKTYTATYKPILNEYTVTWKDEDGTVLETDEKVPYGTMPTYNGKEPTKAATAEYSYKFDGWSIKVAEVTGDITYTATYAATLNEYTVEASNLPEGVQLSFSGKETVEAGKVLTFTVNVLDGYDKTDDFVVTVNGTKLEPDSNGTYTIPNILRDTLISVSGVQKVDYNIAEGDNAKYTQGALGVGRFVFKRTVNDKVTFGRFTYAELDGKVLDPNNYTKASGSLIIELKKEFMATLPVGEHLLKVHFSDDTEGVIAHFFIEAAATDPSVTTGDTSAPILWIILLAAALLGLLGVIYSKSRQAAR